MSVFHERQGAFEAKFAHDMELVFKTNVKTTKLFGLWAAEQLNLSGNEAETYADQLVVFDIGEPGFEDVLRKVKADLPDISETRLYAELDRCAAVSHSDHE